MNRAVDNAWYQSWTNPSRARRIAGASATASSIVPNRSRARQSPATEPGTATDRGPNTLASCSTFGHGKSAVDTPPVTRYIDSWAAEGAAALKSTVSVSSSVARCTSIVPAPPIVLMNGSTTVIAKAVATAASIALPPRASTPAPTSAPLGCEATTDQRSLLGDHQLGPDHAPPFDAQRRSWYWTMSTRRESAKYSCQPSGYVQASAALPRMSG